MIAGVGRLEVVAVAREGHRTESRPRQIVRSFAELAYLRAHPRAGLSEIEDDDERNAEEEQRWADWANGGWMLNIGPSESCLLQDAEDALLLLRAAIKNIDQAIEKRQKAASRKR